MAARRPRTAAQSTALPSLAALLASGVIVDGCDRPAESTQRLQRLTDHGQQAGRALEGGRYGQAATQVGVGLGLLHEPAETRIQSAGEATVVGPEPPPQVAGGAAPPVTPQPDPTPSQATGGAPIPVTPQVDPTPQTDVDPTLLLPQTHTAGAPMPVQPTPHVNPTPHHPPTPRINPRGGATAVHPGSDDL